MSTEKPSENLFLFCHIFGWIFLDERVSSWADYREVSGVGDSELYSHYSEKKFLCCLGMF